MIRRVLHALTDLGAVPGCEARLFCRTASFSAACGCVLLGSLLLIVALMEGGVPDWEAECRMQRLPQESEAR